MIDQAIEAKVAEFNKRSGPQPASSNSLQQTSKKNATKGGKKQLKAQQDSLNREIGEWKAQVQAGSAGTDAARGLTTTSAAVQRRAQPPERRQRPIQNAR